MKKLLLITLISITAISCKEYLDAKPDKKLVVPQSMQDVNALLDHTVLSTASIMGESASDNIYYIPTIYNSISSLRDRNIYIWENDAIDGDGGIWTGKYNHAFVCNVALETLAKINPPAPEQAEWNRLRGSALFLRSYAFFELMQLFSSPYESGRENTQPGIPLKVLADVNEKTQRPTVEENYSRIIMDMKEALRLLPQNSSIATRPNQKSACALLARILLTKGDYPQALHYADTALSLYGELLDYNMVNTAAVAPFARFNKEVLFHCTGAAPGLNPNWYRVDTLLYDSYSSQDLRKQAFFRYNGDKNYTFKGSYDGLVSSSFFAGLTTAELYLIRAECLARDSKTGEALEDLNHLYEHRWGNTTPFMPYEASNAAEALELVLKERRKELAFRGIRWNDLRRLQSDSRFAVTLQRNLEGKLYVLNPESKRYVFPIPQTVIELSGIAQNQR